VDFIFTLHRTH